MDADWVLIFKMKQGDENAWEQFIRRYYGDILKYCFFHCHDSSLSEDLTQEVFLRFVSALAEYQHRGKAKNFLYTIARNLCINEANRKRENLLEIPEERIPDPSLNLEERMMLEEVIRKLPEQLREVVLLHYYQGLTLSEVASVLKIGLPLVKYRLKRAKDQIKKETEGYAQ